MKIFLAPTKLMHMTRKHLSSILAGASLLGFFVAGAPATGQSLEEAMAAAYAVNPALKAERSKYEATNQGIWTARSEFLPTVTGNYLGEHNAFKTRGGTSDRAFFHELGVAMSQTLFQGFAGVNRLNQAHEEAASGRNQLIGAEQTLMFNTADAYLRVVRDRAILNRLKAYSSVVQREVNAARARYKSGDATRTDIEQALARLAEAQGNSDQAVGDLEASEALYTRLTGQKPANLGWPAIPKAIEPAGLDDALTTAFQNNPSIRAAIADARAARYAARAATGDMLPRVTLESEWQNGYRGNLGNRDDEDFRVGVRVTAPILTGGRNIAAVKRARFTAAQVEYELDDTQQIIRENVTRAMKQRTASRLRAEAGKRAIDANRRAVKGLLVEFDSGQRSLLDVLDGERELLLSQVDHIRARYDSRIADFFLLANIGRLAPQHFSIIEERPAPVPRIVPEFNTWDLRLGPTENDVFPAGMIEVATSEPVLLETRPSLPLR
ncbi:TolC family outer membrane protein [Roseibium marinum]|uniref:Outer membrane protein/adhesin transport system outer membrane protein n=1 Tax=Roseibium marinum TaxID=281252 RepID=A0A2S3ULC7_9HYPH|nr:TolC family outer membrane protein [Roseibium marinum]POF28506.1 outer membrane protein/adhesin transport system outer membrane protein [Roseibium marinum]